MFPFLLFRKNISTQQLKFLILAFVFLPLFCSGKNLSVVINEIAWMGTLDSSLAEWIELYNTTKKEIDLEGWILTSQDNTPKISLKGKIPAEGFFLLERVNDKSVPNIQADLIYRGALNNKGEFLKLLDKQKNLIDNVDCSNGWFAGDNSQKLTMERKDPQKPGSSLLNWQNSEKPGGTPKIQNSLPASNPFSLQQQETKTSSKKDSSCSSNVFISEILPSPQGPDIENEWIELYNKNSFEINISDWKIEDEQGKTNSYIFPKNTKIAPHGFLVLKRSQSKITLQNDKDSLLLSNNCGEIVDTISYDSTVLGNSFAKPNSFSIPAQWTKTPTPGTINKIEKENRKKSPVQKEHPKEETIQQSKDFEKRGLAFEKNFISLNAHPRLALATGLLLAIISAGIILFLKQKRKIS